MFSISTCYPISINEKPQYIHEFLCESKSVSTEFKRSIYSIFHPIQLSWTDCSFLKRWPVEILKISKIGDMSQKILNISMSSWPIWIIFGAHRSAHHPLQFIPYNHRDQTTSSWSAGQFKSSQSAKSAKSHGKTWISPWVLIRFGICFNGIQALNLLYN